MKRFLTLILLLGSILTANAQFGGGSSITGKISGTIIDSATKKPVQYASVALYYSNGTAPINGMLTDEKGQFKLYNIKPNSYKITISFVGGYVTKTVNPIVTTLSKPDNNAGDILIRPDNKVLDEVKVVGQQALIENHIDKLVYNAEKDLTSAGGNAADVLQKVPMVSVDINGNVAIRGDQNVKVLINGRPSGITTTSLSDALKAIPADQIKTIEVITSPSAKYDAEGSAGIINIVTKSKNISGISGSFSGGIGTKQNNGNFNFNYNKNRFSLSANLSGNLTWPQTTPTDFLQSTTRGDTISNTRNHSTSNVKRHAIMGSFNLGYQFNNYNTLSSDFRLNGGGFHINGTQNNQLGNNFTPTSIYSGTSLSNNTLSGFDWDIDYDHKFKKEGEDLDFSAQWSHSIINTDYAYDYNAISPNQRGFNNGTNNEYTLQADYTLPVSKLLKVEAGGKSIFRRLSSNYVNYNDTTADRSLSPADYIYDALNSNDYSYDQNVYAGYTVLTFTLPKSYSILAGARYENTTIDGVPNNPLQTDVADFHSSYGVFIPSLTIQKALNPSNTLKLTYSKRIQRPSLQFLNPFLNTSRIQAQSEGNPELDPEISQTVELNINSFIKTSLINFSIYYKHTSNNIEGILTQKLYTVGDLTLPATLTTYENIGYLNSFGSSFFGSINPIKILTIRASIDASTFHPNASQEFQGQQLATTDKTHIQYNAFLSASVNLKSGIIAEAFAVDRSNQYTLQGSNPGFYYYALGVRKQFDNKKASLGLNMVNPFAYYENFNSDIKSPTLTQSSYTHFPFRSFGLTFSYSFGKTTFSNPTDKKKGVNNDDLKQDDQGGMGGGGR